MKYRRIFNGNTFADSFDSDDFFLGMADAFWFLLAFEILENSELKKPVEF